MKAILATIIFFSALTSFATSEESEFRTATIDIGIVVSDLEKSIKFYTDAVGFKVTGEFTASKEITKDSGLSAGETLVIKKLSLGEGKGATTIKLMQAAKPAAKSDQTYITSSNGFSYLTIHVNSTKAALKRLEKSGIKVLAKGPVNIPDTKIALTVVKDPDGNFVEFVGPADQE